MFAVLGLVACGVVVEIQAINWFAVHVRIGGIERREEDSLFNEEAEVLLLSKDHCWRI